VILADSVVVVVVVVAAAAAEVDGALPQL